MQIAAVAYKHLDGPVKDRVDLGRLGFKRSQDEPYPTVVALIEKAQALKIDAHFIEAESFDELLSDLIRFLPPSWS